MLLSRRISPLISLISALIFAYLAYRGYALAITHDEAYSFLQEHELLFKQSAGTANNHPLNTIFMFLEDRILGTQPIFLRLHSILAYLIFAFFSFQIIQKISKNSIIVVCFWLICNLNPFLLDFFSLARGYGMACAFSVASVAMLLDSRWRIGFMFACLATLSNYTFLHFFNASLVFYVIKKYEMSLDKNSINAFVKEIFKDFKNWFFVPFFYMLVFCLLSIIKRNGDLEYGGRNGMGVDTFKTLFDGFLYFKTLAIENWLLGNFLFGIIMFIQIYIVFYFYKTKKILPFTLLFLLTIDSCLAVFYLFKTPLPLDRTALIFYALGIFSAAEIFILWLPKTWQALIALPITAAFIFHFLNVANLQYCFIWRFNADINRVESECFAPNKVQNIGTGSCMDGSILNYYNIVNPQDFHYKMPLIEGFNLNFDTNTLLNNLKKYDMIWINEQEKIILDKKGICAKNIRVFPASRTVVMWGF
jgi:hypothetical protein